MIFTTGKFYHLQRHNLISLLPASLLGRLIPLFIYLIIAVLACDDATIPPKCSLNSDCISPRICVEQSCVFECVESRDCVVGLSCIENHCVDDSQMQTETDQEPTPECRLNRDCQTGYECNRERCEPLSGFCEQNSDCGPQESCSRSTHLCEPTLAPGECLTVGDCFSDERCQDGYCVVQDTCTNGGCPMSCQQDTDCSAGDICEEQSCIAGCEPDECPANLRCRAGRCQPECTYNSDCIDPMICAEGTCIFECVDDRDCEPGLYCLKNTCGVECETDSDCDDGLICREGRCDYECIEDQDCEGNLRCVGSICIAECTQDGDCQDGLICQENLCDSECNIDEDCPTPQLCQNSTCTYECMTNQDCSQGQSCSDYRCITEESPYNGTFLISSTMPIQRCNPTTSINFSPRVANTTQDGQGFSLFFANPPTNYVGMINDNAFTVSWSGPNGSNINCGNLTTSNTYQAAFTNPDFFQGTLNISFFFLDGSCNCQLSWSIIGIRQ